MSLQPEHKQDQQHKIKVLLLESVAQSAVDTLVEAGYTVETHHRLNTEQLKKRIKGVHAIGLRSKTLLTKEVLDCADKLKVIGHFCIGTDQTDLKHAASKAIPVFNSPYANTRSVAELVIAEMIMLARKAGDKNNEMHRGVWNKVSKGCFEIRGKKLGIVGYGHVGQQLSILAEAIGMSVVYYDINPQMKMGNATAAPSLEAVLKTCDFVSLHVPLTKLTTNMIDKEQVDMMKQGSYLLNLSRGPVCKLEPIAEALKSGKLAGAAFDVYPEEPGVKCDDYEMVLQNCPNTILTPHIGGSTEEAQTTIGFETAAKLLDFFNTGSTVGAVNVPQISMPKTDKTTTHRLINFHIDRPGVLGSINDILRDYNISSQTLATKNGIGYLMVEIDKAVSNECERKLEELETTIQTRVICSPLARAKLPELCTSLASPRRSTR